MILNRVEFALMNNPVRTALQERFEGPRLLKMGGGLDGGRALEIGCGRGVGAGLILDLFRAGTVDAFDLDPRMVERARERLAPRVPRVRLWVGDAIAIPVASESYDAVFDFGVVHHVPDWRRALEEVQRVLKPGGRLYVEEVHRRFVTHPVIRRVLRHPQSDRFDTGEFCAALAELGFTVNDTRELLGAFFWVTAVKRRAESALARRRWSS